MSQTVRFRIEVPIQVTAKVEVDAGGQVMILDAYMNNDMGGSYVRSLGEEGYLKVLRQAAVEAREADADAARRDRDARR